MKKYLCLFLTAILLLTPAASALAANAEPAAAKTAGENGQPAAEPSPENPGKGILPGSALNTAAQAAPALDTVSDNALPGNEAGPEEKPPADGEGRTTDENLPGEGNTRPDGSGSPDNGPLPDNSAGSGKDTFPDGGLPSDAAAIQESTPLPDGAFLPSASGILSTTEEALLTPSAEDPAIPAIAIIEINDSDTLSRIGGETAFPLDGSYLLTGDIELADTWTPIGTPDTPFTGTFDGSGHTVSGLSAEPEEGPAGFFGTVGPGALVKGLTLEVSSVAGTAAVGALAGQSTGAAFEGCCATSDGTPENGAVSGITQVGGLIGLATDTALTGCAAALPVRAENGWAGGLVGELAGEGSALRQSFATGRVETAAGGAGGLAGRAVAAHISDCYATGRVTAGQLHAGGLAGRAEGTHISRSLASGSVRADNGNCGGIAGEADYRSSVTGSVAAGRYAAVLLLNKAANRIVPASQAALDGNLAYAGMGCASGGDTTDPGTSTAMAALRQKTTYEALGWDFAAVWEWPAGGSAPRLRSALPQPEDALDPAPLAPAITAQPVSSSYPHMGEELRLTVKAAGSGLTYQWKKDGADLADTDSGGEPDQETVTGANTAQLTIRNIRYTPSAAYVAVVTNSHGDAVTRASMAKVTPEATLPTVTDPADSRVVEGEQASFQTTAGTGRPGETLSYQWEMSADGGETWQPLPKATAAAYTTGPAAATDNGNQYRCVVTNTYYTTSKSAVTKAAALTVLKAIRGIAIDPAGLTMQAGETKQLAARCLPADAGQDQAIRWSAGTGAGLVNVERDTGKVTAFGPGTACVVATSWANGDISAVCFITIEEEEPLPAPDAIRLTTGDAVLSRGRITDELAGPDGKPRSIRLQAEASGAVAWSSADKKVATVDAGGTVTYVAGGTTRITAKTRRGQTASLTLDIKDRTPRLPVAALAVNTGQTRGIPFTAMPGDGAAYDGIRVTGISPLPAAGSFTVDTSMDASRAPACRLSAVGVPKGRYRLTMKALDGEAEIGLPFTVTVTVTAGFPAAKIKLPKLNIFYRESGGPITVTGKDLPPIEGIRLLPSEKAAEGDITENFEVTREGNRFFLNTKEVFGSLIKSAPAVKGRLEIRYEGFSQPYTAKVTIPVNRVAPKLKFARATQQADPENDLNVDFTITGGEVAEAVPADKAAFAQYFDGHSLEGSTLTLSLNSAMLLNKDGSYIPAATNKAYHARMDIWAVGARYPVPLKATIKVAKPGARPTFRLSRQTVAINRRYEGQKQAVEILPSQANAEFAISQIVCNEALDIGNFGDSITVMPGARSRAGKFKCRIYVECNGKTSELTMTVNVSDKETGVALTDRKGAIDLASREGSALTYRPVLRNYLGDIREVWIVDEGDGNSSRFTVALTPDGRVSLKAVAGLGMEEDFIKGKSYRLKLGFTVEAAEASPAGELFFVEAFSPPFTVKPVQSKVKHQPLAATLYAGRASYGETVDLAPAAPAGAAIDRSYFNAYCGQNRHESFYYYLDDAQILHVKLREGAWVKPGKYVLKFPVVYQGQGLEKVGRDYDYKPVTLKVTVNVAR